MARARGITLSRRTMLLAAIAGVVGLFLFRAVTDRAPDAGAAAAGRYRLRPPDYYQGTNTPPGALDYYLTLNEGGTAQLEQAEVSSGRTTVAAQGTWTLDDEALLLEIAELNGQPVASPYAIRYRMVDGFPIATEAATGAALDNLENARFTIGAGERHPLVQELHRRLAGIEWLGFTDPGDDLYSDETRKAVVAFQQTQGLYPNGEVNGTTWVFLGNPRPPLPIPTPLPAPVGVTDPGSLPTHTGDGRPIVYLTFDDGPSEYTPQVVDLLNRYGASATFFVLGEHVENAPDAIRMELESGHAVGNHTYDHTSLEGISTEGFMAQVEETQQLILGAAGELSSLGYGARLLRPPYGEIDPGTQQYATDLGYAVVMWDVDPQDWRRPGADVIADHVLLSVSPGDIVLMHDGGGDRSQSVQALETVLSELSSQGYAFHNIFAP